MVRSICSWPTTSSKICGRYFLYSASDMGTSSSTRMLPDGGRRNPIRQFPSIISATASVGTQRGQPHSISSTPANGTSTPIPPAREKTNGDEGRGRQMRRSARQRQILTRQPNAASLAMADSAQRTTPPTPPPCACRRRPPREARRPRATTRARYSTSPLSPARFVRTIPIFAFTAPAMAGMSEITTIPTMTNSKCSCTNGMPPKK